MGTVDVVHIRDEVIGPDGRLEILKTRPLGRLGYYDYTTVDSIFEMVIPGDNENLLKGLEGAAGGKEVEKQIPDKDKKRSGILDKTDDHPTGIASSTEAWWIFQSC